MFEVKLTYSAQTVLGTDDSCLERGKDDRAEIITEKTTEDQRKD